MPRYKLRTLLIILAVGPPLIAGYYFLLESTGKPPLRALAEAGIAAITMIVVVLLMIAGVAVLDRFNK